MPEGSGSTYRVWYVIVRSVGWGVVELEPEVVAWLRGLPDAVRIAYDIASGRRIILLTVLSEQQRRERAGVARAERAMKRCVTEWHTAEEDAHD